MLRRWFDDDFIAEFNFFFNLWEILEILHGKNFLQLHALSTLKKYNNMIAFFTLEGSAGEWR